MEKMEVSPDSNTMDAPSASASWKDRALVKITSGMRPWKTDFADTMQFALPVPRDIVGRIESNVDYYASNYAVIAATILFLAVVSQPYFLFTLVVVGALWGYAYSIKELVIKGQAITPKQKLVGLCAATALLLVVFAGTAIFVVIGITAAVVFGHAALRNPNYESMFQAAPSAV
eukprot:GILK01003701.1.p1 GENE.GILK01003701.1~~GILK01003701.1.p1  ORF type:complete len:181 (-),score=29.35 GILK01003701.1:97-618(-)